MFGCVCDTVSVSRGASERQRWGSGQNCLVRYARGVDARSSRGSNETQFTPSLHEDLHKGPCLHRHTVHTAFERVNPGLVGYLKPQCLKDLGNYERRPYLLENHHLLGRPEKTQLEVLLDQSPSRYPTCELDLGHGWNRERTRVVNVGDVAAHGSALSESHQPNGVLGTIRGGLPATRHRNVDGICLVAGPLSLLSQWYPLSVSQSNQAKPKCLPPPVFPPATLPPAPAPTPSF